MEGWSWCLVKGSKEGFSLEKTNINIGKCINVNVILLNLGGWIRSDF